MFEKRGLNVFQYLKLIANYNSRVVTFTLTRLKHICIILVSVILFINHSNAQQNLLIEPEKPIPGNEVKITYNPSSTLLDSSIFIQGRVYMLNKTGTFTITRDIPLNKDGNFWAGKFQLLKNCVAFAIVFENEKQILDTNDNKAYIFTISESSGAPIVGANAALAGFYVNYSNIFKMEQDKESLKAMMENEFHKNPELFQHYFKPYLKLIDINDPGIKREFISKLDKLYGLRDLLNERSLISLVFLYKKYGQRDKANKCTETILKKYPNGQRAFQYNSRPFQNNVFQSLDFNDKIIAYKKLDEYFKNNLANNAPNISSAPEQIFRNLENIASPEFEWAKNHGYYHMEQRSHLKRILNHCTNSNELNKWIELVDSIENNFVRMQLYDDYARKMYKDGKVTKKTLNLSSIAVDWTFDYINAPRSLFEATFHQISENQLEIRRKLQYAEFLMTNGELLQNLNKNEEALMAINKVVEYSNLSDIRLNDRIVTLLLESNNNKLAEEIGKETVRMGKASENIKKFLADDDNSDSGDEPNELNEEFIENRTEYLASVRINKDAPSFSLKSIQGEEVSLSGFEGKVVLLDFWATWCAPCIYSFNAYQKVIEMYEDDPNVAFLFINLDKYREDIEKEIDEFLAKRGFDFNVLLDSEGVSANAYSVNGLPTKFVIDKNGTIIFRDTGIKKDDEEMVQDLSLMIEMAKDSGSIE